MRYSSIILFLIITGNSLAETQIHQINYDWDNHHLELDISYSGGCGDHQFNLQFSSDCLQIFPSRQTVELIHQTQDTCEASIQQHLIFKLDQWSEQLCSNPVDLIFQDDNHLSPIRVGLLSKIEGELFPHSAVGGQSTGLGLKTEANQIYEVGFDYLPYQLDQLIEREAILYGKIIYKCGAELGKRKVFEAFHLVWPSSPKLLDFLYP